MCATESDHGDAIIITAAEDSLRESYDLFVAQARDSGVISKIERDRKWKNAFNGAFLREHLFIDPHRYSHDARCGSDC